MKRPIVLFAIFLLTLCALTSMSYYKLLVGETRRLIPSNETFSAQPISFSGKINAYDFTNNSAIFSTNHPQTGQKIKLRLRYSRNPDFSKAIERGHYHFTVFIDPMSNPYRSPKNSHAFDYDRYLYALNIWGQYDVQLFEVEGKKHFCLHCARLKLRKKVSASLDQRYSNVDAGFLKALILAERSNFMSYDHYKELGLAHLFAISGLHFGMVYQLLKKCFCFKNRFVNTLLILAILGAFLFWIGDSYSAQRALILIAYFEMGHLFSRKVDHLNAIAVSSILILLVQPYAILATSFQLSFYAYFCIAILLKAIDVLKWENKFMRSIWISLIIQALLLPSNVYFFRSYNGLSFLANLLMVPLVGVILPIALLDAIFSFLPFTGLTTMLTKVLLLIFNRVGDLLPVVKLPMQGFRNWDFYALLIFAFCFVLISVFNQTVLKRRMILNWVVILLILLVLVMPLKPTVELHFVDVGHGDFSLIKHGKTVVLKDTGEGFVKASEYLMKQDIYYVNAVILSHAHRDHYGGLKELIENVHVAHVYMNLETYLNVADILDDHQQFYTIVDKEMALNFNAFDVHIFPVHSETNTNENALISSFSVGDFMAYFLGDIGSKQMESVTLLESFDVLKVPHHGSKGSLNPRFYKTYDIKYGILSNGTKYNMPHKEVVATIEHTGAVPISTYDHGGIVFKFHRNRYRIKTYLHGRY